MQIFGESSAWVFCEEGKREVNNDERIQGKLNANSCTYMDFSRESGGTSGGACKESSKSFFTNLKKILVG